MLLTVYFHSYAIEMFSPPYMALTRPTYSNLPAFICQSATDRRALFIRLMLAPL